MKNETEILVENRIFCSGKSCFADVVSSGEMVGRHNCIFFVTIVAFELD